MRKLLRSGAAVAFVAVIMTATNATAAKPTAEGPSGSVRIAMGVTYKPGFDLLIANFNRIYPNITVTPSYYVSGGPYTSVIVPQLTAGNAPDLFWVTGARSAGHSVWPLAEAGYLTDLSKRRWVKRMYPADKDQYVWKGKVYAYDFGLSILAIPSYNKEFFAQNRLQVPRTFSQLLQLCRTIVGLGKIPIAFAGGSTGVNSSGVVALAANTVLGPDPSWLQKRLNHQTTFAASRWRRALQMFVEMKDAKCFSPGAESLTIPQMQQQFASGQATMMFTYAGLNGQVAQITPNLKIGLFPLPGDTAANTWLMAQAAGGIALNVKSSNKQAALTFIDFLGREKQQRLFAKVNYLVSPFDALKGNLTGIYADLKPSFTAKKVVSTLPAQWPNTSMSPNSGASIQGLLTGQKTVDQVLADMDKYFDAPQ